MTDGTEHLDVAIVGAGLAGIGFAHHLSRTHPQRSFAILEARDRLGGTWDLFRYPGLRSDVDLHLYGYAHKPWTGRVGVAPAADILRYLDEAAEEGGLTRRIRYRTRMTAADWSGEDARWMLTLDTPEGARRVTASWLQLCTGYYSYASGHAPDFPGRDAYQGRLVHPQAWPEDLDIAGKRVVVVGSGATAVTMIPAMAGAAAKVTMLQRSPSYVFAAPMADPLTRLFRAALPRAAAYRATRWKNLQLDRLRVWMSINKPDKVRAKVRAEAMRHLPPDFDYDRHFVPAHGPAEQRVCLSPDGDLFSAIARGEVEVATDTIDTLTPGESACPRARRSRPT